MSLMDDEVKLFWWSVANFRGIFQSWNTDQGQELLGVLLFSAYTI